MSVNPQSLHLLRQELTFLRQSIQAELSAYQTFLLRFHAQLPTLASSPTSVHPKTSALQVLIVQLKEDNSKLRNKHMEALLYQEELQTVRDLLLKENREKEERVKELAGEVQTIRGYMLELKELHSEQPIVNFDDNEQEGHMLPQGLEVIREVSEHDLSITMSLQSFKSDILEEDSSHKTYDTLNEQSDPDSENRPSAANLVNNYQDALEILKNYNSGNGAVMKKNRVEPEANMDSRIRVGNVVERNYESVGEVRKVRNDTMSKLKKMKKIEDLDIESRISLPNRQRKTSTPDQKPTIRCSHATPDEQMSEKSLAKDEDTEKSSSSMHSNGYKSNFKEEGFSLEEYVKPANDLLHKISYELAYPIQIERIKATLHRISYKGGLEFQGHCDEAKYPNGYGKLTMRGETIYQGEWRNAHFHGWGKFILLPFVQTKEKAIIEVDGNFRCGQIDGTTLCIFNSGERFMGLMRGDHISGEGTFVGEKGIVTGHWESSRLIFLI